MGNTQVSGISEKLQGVIKQSDKNGNNKIDNEEIRLFLKNGVLAECSSEELRSVIKEPAGDRFFETYFDYIKSIEERQKKIEELKGQREKRLDAIYDDYCNEHEQSEQQRMEEHSALTKRMSIMSGAVAALSVLTLGGIEKHLKGMKFFNILGKTSPIAIPVGLAVGALTYFIGQKTAPKPTEPDVQNDGKSIIVNENNDISTLDYKIEKIDAEIEIINCEIEAEKTILFGFLDR